MHWRKWRYWRYRQNCQYRHAKKCILPASDAGEKKKEKICLVEYSGLEPLTSTLPVLRSSQMS